MEFFPRYFKATGKLEEVKDSWGSALSGHALNRDMSAESALLTSYFEPNENAGVQLSLKQQCEVQI